MGVRLPRSAIGHCVGPFIVGATQKARTHGRLPFNVRPLGSYRAPLSLTQLRKERPFQRSRSLFNAFNEPLRPLLRGFALGNQRFPTLDLSLDLVGRRATQVVTRLHRTF